MSEVTTPSVPNPIRIGTRGSLLATTQAGTVRDALIEVDGLLGAARLGAHLGILNRVAAVMFAALALRLVAR